MAVNYDTGCMHAKWTDHRHFRQLLMQINPHGFVYQPGGRGLNKSYKQFKTKSLKKVQRCAGIMSQRTFLNNEDFWQKMVLSTSTKHRVCIPCSALFLLYPTLFSFLSSFFRTSRCSPPLPNILFSLFYMYIYVYIWYICVLKTIYVLYLNFWSLIGLILSTDVAF